MKTPIQKPINIPGRRKVLTKNRILESQKHTRSNMEAARWLQVTYNTYKKWAKYYGVFEQHLNQKGIGIKKGFGKWRVNVEDIVLGKRKPPKRWSHKVVKKQLAQSNLMFSNNQLSVSPSVKSTAKQQVSVAMFTSLYPQTLHSSCQ